MNSDYDEAEVMPSIPIKKSSPIYSILERLYIENNSLPPSYGFISTAHDIHQSASNIQEVKNNNSNPYIKSFINGLYTQYALNKPGNKVSTWAGCSLGMDYLYRKTKVLIGEDSTYFSRFRDVDFINKYNDKWNIFDLSFQAAYKNRYFFSYQFGLKEYWYKLRKRTHGIPINFLELDNNFNQQSIFIASYNKYKFFFGKTKYSIGLGEGGKLLLSDQSPALDAIGFSLNQNGMIAIHHLTAVVDNVTDKHLREQVPPKYLFLHRLEISPIKRFRLGLSELLLINSYIKWQYINPFKVYHNVNNFASTNIISAIDAEILIKEDLIVYGTFAIDEIDFELLEQNLGDKNKTSLGYQLGCKHINPFNIHNSTVVLEWVKLDKWFYNHYAGFLDSGRDLTITHTESAPYTDGVETYTSHLGHPNGGNSETIYLKFIIKYFTLDCQYSKLGEPTLFQRAFKATAEEDMIAEVFEYRSIIGLCYSNPYFNKYIGIQLSAHLVQVNNYHNIATENHSIPELNIKFNYQFNKWSLSL